MRRLSRCAVAAIAALATIHEVHGDPILLMMDPPERSSGNWSLSVITGPTTPAPEGGPTGDGLPEPAGLTLGLIGLGAHSVAIGRRRRGDRLSGGRRGDRRPQLPTVLGRRKAYAPATR